MVINDPIAELAFKLDRFAENFDPYEYKAVSYTHLDVYKRQTFESATKHYPIYITKYKGEDIVLCQAPVGAAAATRCV